MPDNALVFNYTWTDDEVLLRGWQGTPGCLHETPLRGWIAFRLLPGRYCTGHNNGDGFVPCPDDAPSTQGSWCMSCFVRDTFRPCLACDGFACPRLHPAAERRCRDTHHLYLAHFGGSSVKVGTANDRRRRQRIVEQGPLSAARIACADGPTIRQMETLLVNAGFVEAMRRSRKTALLESATTEVEARSQIVDGARHARDTLPPPYRVHLHTPVFVALPELAQKSREHRIQPLQIEDDRVFEGHVAGAIGHLLFLDDGDGRFALDLGALRGRRIEWNPTGQRKRSQAQLGLF